MWNKWAKCLGCREIVADAQFSSKFFMPICPHCGAPNNVEFVIARSVWVGKWYLPWTWYRVAWEER
jgi:hypothetical protein